MKQTMKCMQRLVRCQIRKGNTEAVALLRKILGLVALGRLVPLAQSHREVAAGGPLFRERHTGLIWSMSPSGILDSSRGLPDYLDGKEPGRALLECREGSGLAVWRPLGRSCWYNCRVEETRITHN